MATGTIKPEPTGGTEDPTVAQATDMPSGTPDTLLVALEAEVRAQDGVAPADPKTTALVDEVELELLEVLEKRKQAVDQQNGATTQAESTDENPTLQRFKADYDKLPEDLKAKCPWEVGKARLLANDGEKLRLAQAMEQGGILFGVDKDGKLLFADGGDEPIMKGMSGPDTHARVVFKHDRLDELGKMELDKNGQPIPTGYRMFTYRNQIPIIDPGMFLRGGESFIQYIRGEEIGMFQSHTGKPLVRSPDGNEWRSSFLEAEDGSPLICMLHFYPKNQGSFINDFQLKGPTCGVRRLLRV